MKKKPVEHPAEERALYLHEGKAFESQGSGLFAKDVALDGEYWDEKSGRTVPITAERRALLARETNRFLENGNEIPFPDGHTWDAMKNLGDWPGPFVVHEDRLVGVVRPKGADVLAKIQTGKINRVSMVIAKNHVDPKGVFYPEVIIQCCATPIPVLTGQRDFVALSQDGKPLDVFTMKPEGAQAAPESLDEPTFQSLAQGFAPPSEPSFEELAQFFRVSQ